MKSIFKIFPFNLFPKKDKKDVKSVGKKGREFFEYDYWCAALSPNQEVCSTITTTSEELAKANKLQSLDPFMDPTRLRLQRELSKTKVQNKKR